MNETLAPLPVEADFRERDPVDDLRELCPSPSLVLDCGAGHGQWAKRAVKAWPNAVVHSFEPCSRFSMTLQPLCDNHKVHRVAVGSETGNSVLNLTQGPESNSFLPFLPGSPLAKIHRVVGQETVPVMRLDDYFGLNTECPSGDVGILKLDLQGTEFDAIDGASELLQKHKPIVFSEVAFQPQYVGQPLLAEMDAFMEERGYQRVYLYGGPLPDVWGDAIYVHNETFVDPLGPTPGFGTPADEPIRLNIGAGDVKIPGFTAIDRKFGTEAYPLQYADNSVDEIRASHILEHFSFQEALTALAEWCRVLKPGGKIRVAVPDFDKIDKADRLWPFYVMGGQTDGNDYHKSLYDEERLTAYLQAAGFERISKWESKNTDCSSLVCSLNLEAYKAAKPAAPVATKKDSGRIKIRAILGCPRIGWNDGAQCFDEALQKFGIPIMRFQGCFWGQNMQKGLEQCLKDGLDWVLTLDYDSMFTAKHLDQLIDTFGTHPEIDALAALQMRRGQEFPLCSSKGLTQAEVTKGPFRVDTAHFGMTLIRVECLKDLAKPWLHAVPDKNGEWGDGRRDDDITFWDKWKAAGKTLYIDPNCRIGHLELVVSEYNDDWEPQHLHIDGWWDKNGKERIAI